MKKKVILYIFLSACFCLSGNATGSLRHKTGEANYENIFNKANTFYRQKEFGKAITDYKAILKKGFKSGNLYYNMGNSYLSSRDIGKAIVNYERARRLMPRDGDLLLNIRFAKSLMKQGDPASQQFPLINSMERAADYFTLREILLFICAFYWLAVFLAVAAMFFKAARPYLVVLIAALGMLFFLAFIPAVGKITDLNRSAIVITGITDAFFEPLKIAQTHFPLYEGMEVEILRKEGAWFKIKRKDGKIGWVKKNTVELIGI
ncbi:MAG: hypothetical protein HQ579_06860 [Candidatus Omnitrophica bacterium]|nr:hypothetical protein [Candidatus Omnitrophota bacterium]